MAKKNISIVIPTYNRAHLIKRAINSILNQSYTDCEIIIADDASEDNTKDVVEAYQEEKIRYCKIKINIGQQGARNVGVKNSKGDWILFLDSDDELVDNALNTIDSYIDKVNDNIGVIAFPAIDAQTGKFCGFVERGEVIARYDDVVCEKKAHGEFIKCVRREVFAKYKFNEEVRGLNSLFWWEIARDWDVLYINRPLRIYYRGREDNIMNPKNITWRSEHLSRGMEKLLQEHGQRLSELCPQKLAEKYLELAYYCSVSGKRMKVLKNLKKYLSITKKINLKSMLTIAGYLLLGKKIIFRLKSCVSKLMSLRGTK